MGMMLGVDMAAKYVDRAILIVKSSFQISNEMILMLA